MASFASIAFAQLPAILTTEEEAYKEAMRAVQYDYTDTDQLTKFIERYLASRFKSSVLLALEKSQIIAKGTYHLPVADPTLELFTPEEQPWHLFYESQKELAGDEPNLKKLSDRYAQLWAMDDDDFNDEANYYLGYIDYAEGKLNTARKRFNSLPKESKYTESTQFYLMQIDYAEGNYENVLKNLQQPFYSDLQGEKATERDRIMAECLLQTNKKGEALEYFKRYLSQTENPIAPSAYNCAVLAFNNGDNKTAQQAAIKAASSNDEGMRQHSYMLLGQSYMLTEETPKAIMAFEQAAQIDVDREIQEAAAYNTLVLTHEKSFSVWGDEVKQMESFLNTYPGSKYADNVSTYLTEVYLTTKNYEAALTSIRTIKQPNQMILDAKQHLLYQCGIQDFVNGNYISANNDFTECLDVKASDNSLQASALFWRGESRYHLEYFSDAASDYTSAIAQANDSHLKAMSNYSLGYVNFKKQDFKTAINYFEKLISSAKEQGTETYYDAMTRMGDCAYYSRDFAKAETYYGNVADAECNSTPYALFQKGFMCGLQKKYSEKQNNLDRLIARYPSNSYIDRAWLEKGNTSLLQNENDAAINAFKYVTDNYPDSPSAPQAAVQLAMTYNNTGRTAEAQKIYEMVAEKYPNTDEALTAIQDLKTISTNQLYFEMPTALAAGDYQKVIDNYMTLTKENVDFRDLQKMELMSAKAYQGLGNETEATTLLESCAKDMRTEAGSEAKYLFAQQLFDKGDADGSLAQITELIQAGSQHQYWLARAIILMSDISIKNNDTFTATEYLKSLKENYNENEEINKMIETRIESMNTNNE